MRTRQEHPLASPGRHLMSSIPYMLHNYQNHYYQMIVVVEWQWLGFWGPARFVDIGFSSNDHCQVTFAVESLVFLRVVEICVNMGSLVV